MTSSTEEFNTLGFEKNLTQLKDTQESIQTLSSWCLKNRQHHKKIVSSWLNVLKTAKVEHRLTLFYLANDVIQYSKRKSYEFVESWGTTLQKATPLVRDEKVKHRILRIFRIWEERLIYDEEFLSDLTGLLSAAAGKQAADVDPNDFQATQLVNKIRQCSVLENDTDQQLKYIHDSKLALNDADALGASLKERRDAEEAKNELDEGIGNLEGYVRALQKELVARAALCHLLQKAHHHYTTQRGEVKVVANAYKNFGVRVRGLKRKLEDLCQRLPSPAASPLPSPPSPGQPVPSPGPDEDLDLPPPPSHESSYNVDKSFSASLTGEDLAGKGFSSFLGSTDISLFSFQNDRMKNDNSANKIEVINSRLNPIPHEDFNIDDFIKSLIPQKTILNPDPNNVGEGIGYVPLSPPPPPPAVLPGLDLLASETHSSHAVPEPLNFYTPRVTPTEPAVTSKRHDSFSAVLETQGGQRWNEPWEMQTKRPLLDTPSSPPARERVAAPVITVAPVVAPRSDVDQRRLSAPPPPPQLPLILESDDVDHRRLPPLPPASLIPVPADRNRQLHKGDVDHRNLISLTGTLPPPPAPPVAPWTPQTLRHIDQDYRTMVDAPPLPPQRAPPSDIVEIMDMEMSDDEHDDEYTRMVRIESSLNRLHGNPLVMRHNQPPPQFRKQEIIKETFINNNKLLVGGEEGHRNNLHKSEPSNDNRGNLVRINSISEDSDVSKQLPLNNYLNIPNENDTRITSPKDIFSDLVNDSMNPINPNLSLPPPDRNESVMHIPPPDFQQRHALPDRIDPKANDTADEWERSDDDQESVPWQQQQQQPAGINPMRPNFAPRGAGFHRGMPPLRFRAGPFQRDFPPRGAGNFRRPWGGPRPPRPYW